MTTTQTPSFAVGSLVSARGRDWVVQPQSDQDFLILAPLGAGDEVTAVIPALERVTPSSFPPPEPNDAGPATSAGLLRTALRIGFRSSAGPFRSVARLSVEPRAYQLVPLLMALRQDTVRMLISDDVGIGKTIEAGLIAAELLEQGDATGLAVLCGPSPSNGKANWPASSASMPNSSCPARSGGSNAASSRARPSSTGTGT